jgi:hypothetical protein
MSDRFPGFFCKLVRISRLHRLFQERKGAAACRRLPPEHQIKKISALNRYCKKRGAIA